MQPREDHDGCLRDRRLGGRRLDDGDAAVEEIVIAVRRIEARRGGDESGIIRRVVRRDCGEFGPVGRGFMGIRDRRRDVVRVLVRRARVVMIRVRVVLGVRGLGIVMMRAVVVVIGVLVVLVPVIVVVLRDRATVGVRRDQVVQPEVQVRRDLEAEHPQRDREPRHGAARAVDRRGATDEHGRGEYSPAGERAGAATWGTRGSCRWIGSARSRTTPRVVPRTTPR